MYLQSIHPTAPPTIGYFPLALKLLLVTCFFFWWRKTDFHPPSTQYQTVWCQETHVCYQTICGRIWIGWAQFQPHRWRKITQCGWTTAMEKHNNGTTQRWDGEKSHVCEGKNRKDHKRPIKNPGSKSSRLSTKIVFPIFDVFFPNSVDTETTD